MARKEILYNGLRWIHVTQPTTDDLNFIQGLHKFDELVIDYLAKPTLHPSLEEYGDNIYFVLHFPVIYTTKQENKTIEVDFLMTKKIVVTVTYEPFKKLNDLFDRCVRELPLKKKYFRTHTGYIMFLIQEYLHEQMIHDRDAIEKALNKLEKNIFTTPDDTWVEQISSVARDIIDFRRVFNTQGSVIELLPDALEGMLGKGAVPKFTSIVVTQGRIKRLLDNHKETIDSLQHTHAALLDNKSNRIMRILTIFSGVMLPLNLIAGIFGMNHVNMPLRDGPEDFWIVVSVMGVIAVCLFIAMKRARWM